MKKLLVLVLLALVFLSACGGDKEEADWKTFESTEGKFSILFLKDPEEQTESVPTVIGTLETKFYMVETKDMAFSVNFVDYPAEIIQSGDVKMMLDGGVQGAVSNVDGTLLEQKDISLDGHPGREMRAEAKLEGDDVIFKARIYLVENRLYMIQVVSLKSKASSADVDKFLDSFQLK